MPTMTKAQVSRTLDRLIGTRDDGEVNVVDRAIRALQAARAEFQKSDEEMRSGKTIESRRLKNKGIQLVGEAYNILSSNKLSG